MMHKVYSTGLNGCRELWESDSAPDGCSFSAEITRCENRGIMQLWKKHGYIEKVLPTYWSISTNFTAKSGMVYGIYNPQITREHKINFNRIFEATEENKLRLLKECEKFMLEGRAFAKMHGGDKYLEALEKRYMKTPSQKEKK